ncbi:BZ3500_MvSof-1268-A1-R1_Chr3-1g05676 [Microbotryum saponariae]|uniref:BZ3500_MvSof-1268-A1-R1_Chr3-1g05676 protein n=1 Tax=Microbotryum saponariae TaxID=289078 RepID=A0A2X0LIQ9_9BASI|nr:BZ3500_MvSof-1268-A1-R1_Chr3-1g05676 [Microbotryum saponariae]SDA04866.1 BZ3501_MvSof-1269-A2-R1_Chr3-1g05346 [Microbotryum saponariae]
MMNDSYTYSSDVEVHVIPHPSKPTTWHRNVDIEDNDDDDGDDDDDDDASPRVPLATIDHDSTPRRQPRTTPGIGMGTPLFLLSSPASSPVQFGTWEGVGMDKGKGKGKSKEVVQIDLLDESSDEERGITQGAMKVLSSESSSDDGEAIVVQGSSRRPPQRTASLPVRPPTSDEDGELPDPATLGFAPSRSIYLGPTVGPSRAGPAASTSSVSPGFILRSRLGMHPTDANYLDNLHQQNKNKKARRPPVPNPFRDAPPLPPALAARRSGSGSASAILSMLDHLPVYHKAKSSSSTTKRKRKRVGIYDDDDDEEGEATTTDSSEIDETSASFRGPPRQFIMNNEGGPVVELDWREETRVWEKEMREEMAGKKKRKKERERRKSEEGKRERAQAKERERAVAVAGNAKRKASTLSLDERATVKANKAAEKERKAVEKARLAKEKAALVKANNLRAGDKATTVMELTIHLSGSDFDQLSDTEDEEEEDGGEGGKKKKKAKKGKKSEQPQWMNIAKLLQTRMDPQGCVVESPETPRRDIGCEGAIRWTRWCDRRWNMEKSIFEPLGEGNELVVEEDSRLIYISCLLFECVPSSALQLSTQIANKTLLRNLQKIQERIGAHSQIILMHYGLNSLYREMENAKQAAYREDTRLRLDNVPLAGPSAPRSVGIGEKQPEKEVIQMELLRVQSQSRCFMIAVNSVEEAVDWIEQLTYDVSQKPYQYVCYRIFLGPREEILTCFATNFYRRQKNMHIAALGTGEDKFASGSNLEDTYVKMLATLKSVTEPVAKGIVGHYPTIKDLYDGWAKLPSGERKNMLVGIGRGSNVTGVATNRTIGAKLSETIYKIFCSEDPGMFL